MTLDARLPDDPGPWQIEPIAPGEYADRLRALARAADFTVLIAPETSGILAGLTRDLSEAGARLLGSTADAVELAGDKGRLAARLEALSIDTPPTRTIVPRAGLPSDTEYPAVLKPVDGAGSFDTFYVADARSLPTAALAMPMAVLQPFIPGNAHEREFPGGPGREAWLIGVGIQRMAVAGRPLPLPGWHDARTVPRGGWATQAGGRGGRGPARVRRCRFHLELGEKTCHDPGNQPADQRPRTSGWAGCSHPAFWPVRGCRLATAVAWEPKHACRPGGTCSRQASLSFRAEVRLLMVAAEIVAHEQRNRATSYRGSRLDIGGANIKAAHSDGPARTVPFEVWKRPDELGRAIVRPRRHFPPSNQAAVTMTAELCDCYPTKTRGRQRRSRRRALRHCRAGRSSSGASMASFTAVDEAASGRRSLPRPTGWPWRIWPPV